MNQLLVMLMFSANDAAQAERLLDYIAILNNKIPRGHCLLVAAPDTHAETQIRIKISAEVAFETVELLAVAWPAIAHTSKTEAINHLFFNGITHATRCYQWPVLLLEPDCVPLGNRFGSLQLTWIEALEAAYYNQPKRYLGSILASPDGKTRSLGRVAIYPRGAGGELKEFCAGKVPFEMAAASMIVPRAEKTKLMQQLAFTAETDRKLIRDNAVLLHHDKQAVLLSALIDEASRIPAPTDTDEELIRKFSRTKPTDEASKPKQDNQHQFKGPNSGNPILLMNAAKAVHVGPPPAGYSEAAEAGVFSPPLASEMVHTFVDLTEPKDKRTKEWKQWKSDMLNRSRIPPIPTT